MTTLPKTIPLPMTAKTVDEFVDMLLELALRTGPIDVQLTSFLPPGCYGMPVPSTWSWEFGTTWFVSRDVLSRIKARMNRCPLLLGDDCATNF